jgi:transcriptional regulator with XRE-family HTH domain
MLAERVGLSDRAISQIERAQSDVALTTLLRLSDSLEVAPAALLKEAKVLDLPTLAPGPKKKQRRA